MLRWRAINPSIRSFTFRSSLTKRGLGRKKAVMGVTVRMLDIWLQYLLGASVSEA